MNSKLFAVGIPTLNRMDLLFPALQIYLKDLSGISIYVLDNGSQQKIVQHPDIRYMDDARPSVAASWNHLCRVIFDQGFENAIIANDDIILGMNTDYFNRLIAEHPGKFITTIVDWCVFILPRRVFEKVGEFDENFTPAYFEDKDYLRRMRLIGEPVVKPTSLSPALYRSNSTAERNSSVHVCANSNRDYYLKKWGGPPGGERYSIPLGEKKKEEK